HPLTIHEILDRGTGLAMSSAYRNLTVLEHAGVVNRVITREDLGRYELAEELTEHHHHLVCSSCGLVRDLGSDADAERLMNVAMRRASEQGFTPATHRLDIVGLCADCTAGGAGLAARRFPWADAAQAFGRDPRDESRWRIRHGGENDVGSEVGVREAL